MTHQHRSSPAQNISVKTKKFADEVRWTFSQTGQISDYLCIFMFCRRVGTAIIHPLKNTMVCSVP